MIIIYILLAIIAIVVVYRVTRFFLRKYFYDPIGKAERIIKARIKELEEQEKKNK